MKDAEKTIRSYVGLKKSFKIIMAVLAAAFVAFIVLSLIFKNQPEPEPVPFNPLTAENGDYCYFDAVGISTWLYKIETKNGSYTSYDTYYIAEDAEGYMIIVNLPMSQQTAIFSQQLYFSGGMLDGSMPKPYRLQGLAVPMRRGSDVRKNISEVLEIDPGDEYESYFGSMSHTSGQSPKQMGSARFEAGAIFAGLAIFTIFMGNMGVITSAGGSIKDLKKYGRLEKAAELVRGSDGSEPLIVGDGYVFVRNKGLALCPEMVQEATCTGTTVSLKHRLELKPTVLNFNDAARARYFMEFIPLECVRDDDVMIKTDSPEKYDFE